MLRVDVRSTVSASSIYQAELCRLRKQCSRLRAMLICSEAEKTDLQYKLRVAEYRLTTEHIKELESIAMLADDSHEYLQTENTTLHEQVQTLSQQVMALNKQMRTRLDDIAMLKKLVQSQAAEISALKSKVVDLEEIVKALSATFETCM